MYDIDLARAVQLLAEKSNSPNSGRSLGQHPEDNKAVTVKSGRYGPYIKYGAVNVTIPKEFDPEKITLEEALPLIEAKAGKPKKAAAGKPKKGS